MQKLVRQLQKPPLSLWHWIIICLMASERARKSTVCSEVDVRYRCHKEVTPALCSAVWVLSRRHFSPEWKNLACSFPVSFSLQVCISSKCERPRLQGLAAVPTASEEPRNSRLPPSEAQARVGMAQLSPVSSPRTASPQPCNSAADTWFQAQE